MLEEFRSYSRKFKVMIILGIREFFWKVFIQDLAIEFNSEISEFICAEKAFALTPGLNRGRLYSWYGIQSPGKN